MDLGNIIAPHNQCLRWVKAAFPFHRPLSAFSSCGHEARQPWAAMCQKATNRIAAIDGLFDHLISGDHFG
jgi:hypothetical protein